MSMSLDQYYRQVSLQFFMRDELDNFRIIEDPFSLCSNNEIQTIVSERKVDLDMLLQLSCYALHLRIALAW